MFFLTKREKVFIGIILLLIITLSGTFYLNKKNNSETLVTSSNLENNDKIEESKNDIETLKEKEIGIYIIGAIKYPGVYILKDGARILDVIEIAGGALVDADLKSINLAKKLIDEEQVYIPKIGEKIEEANMNIQGDITSSFVTSNHSKLGQVNINTANLAELDTLPGIGPSYAQRIIDYRNANGGFKNIDEVKNVAGIGDKRFDSIKEMITID